MSKNIVIATAATLATVGIATTTEVHADVATPSKTTPTSEKNVQNSQVEVSKTPVEAASSTVATAQQGVKDAQSAQSDAQKNYNDAQSNQATAQKGLDSATSAASTAASQQTAAQSSATQASTAASTAAANAANATSENISAASTAVTTAQSAASTAATSTAAAQSTVDKDSAAVTNAQAGVTTAQQGVDSANASVTSAQSAVNAASATMNTSAASDAVTKAQDAANAATSTAASATQDQAKAQDAKTSADTNATSTQAALDQATTEQKQAGATLNSAKSATATAQSGVNTAQTAVTNAQSAVTNAQNSANASQTSYVTASFSNEVKQAIQKYIKDGKAYAAQGLNETQINTKLAGDLTAIGDVFSKIQSLDSAANITYKAHTAADNQTWKTANLPGDVNSVLGLLNQNQLNEIQQAIAAAINSARDALGISQYVGHVQISNSAVGFAKALADSTIGQNIAKQNQAISANGVDRATYNSSYNDGVADNGVNLLVPPATISLAQIKQDLINAYIKLSIASLIDPNQSVGSGAVYSDQTETFAKQIIGGTAYLLSSNDPITYFGLWSSQFGKLNADPYVAMAIVTPEHTQSGFDKTGIATPGMGGLRLTYNKRCNKLKLH